TTPWVITTVWCKITICGLDSKEISKRKVPKRATITAPKSQDLLAQCHFGLLLIFFVVTIVR
ncbi:hypothetical protein, partial [Acidiplasma aeolicum]|uniref:hypothetical protein n=1 Tax=Acidiplasma aeolicum TaxID=507754 RepID=UPI001F46C2CA